MLRLFFGFLLWGDPSLAAEREAVLPAQAKTTLIDINRGKANELMTLKGIGEARAAAIIKGRPYARTDELVHNLASNRGTSTAPLVQARATVRGGRCVRTCSGGRQTSGACRYLQPSTATCTSQPIV